jgi:hypothetical protein
MEFVLKEAQRDMSIYVSIYVEDTSWKLGQQLLHLFAAQRRCFGTRTKLRKAGDGINENSHFRGRVLRGVNTIRSPSTLASRGSPARRPSFRRMALGRTTWPLVESLICMVEPYLMAAL